MKPEALGKSNHRWPWFHFEQCDEERFERLELLKRSSPLRHPVVFHDRRHLTVVADHDDPPVVPEWQRGHDCRRKRLLRRLVKHQAVREFVIEQLARPPLLDQPVNCGRRRGKNSPLPVSEGLNRGKLTGFQFGFAFERDDPLRCLSRWTVPVQRNIEQPLVKASIEGCPMQNLDAPQIVFCLFQVPHQNIDRGMRMAGDQHSKIDIGGHRTLYAREQGESRREALAGAGRSLHQQNRSSAMPADVLDFARLKNVKTAGIGELGQTVKESLLRKFCRQWPIDLDLPGSGQSLIEGVCPALDKAVGDLLRVVTGPVVRIDVNRVCFARFQRSSH